MNRLMWIDLEMTGLDVEKEVIIEVAAIITDLQFRSIEEYHAVVKQPQEYLDAMDEWNTTHHKESGLTDMVPLGSTPEKVEQDLIEITHEHFPDEDIILAGNSIAQDRVFLKKYFTDFSERLHYRMLDVSSWKLIFKSIYDKQYQKSNNHRALDDIRESIAELQYYMSFVKANPTEELRN